jgi:hypothetical protein
VTERVICRECRTKLVAPTVNDRDAFCTRGCFRKFYHLKCLVCEGPKVKGRQLCSKGGCHTKDRTLKRYGMGGKYLSGANVGLPTTRCKVSGNSVMKSTVKHPPQEALWGAIRWYPIVSKDGVRAFSNRRPD